MLDSVRRGISDEMVQIVLGSKTGKVELVHRREQVLRDAEKWGLWTHKESL